MRSSPDRVRHRPRAQSHGRRWCGESRWSTLALLVVHDDCGLARPRGGRLDQSKPGRRRRHTCRQLSWHRPPSTGRRAVGRSGRLPPERGRVASPCDYTNGAWGPFEGRPVFFGWGINNYWFSFRAGRRSPAEAALLLPRGSGVRAGRRRDRRRPLRSGRVNRGITRSTACVFVICGRRMRHRTRSPR